MCTISYGVYVYMCDKKRMRRVGCEKKERRWDGIRSKERTQREKELKRKWRGYLPGLQPPSRLLPPAFSSPWSSWRRAVTWLPLGNRSRRRQLVRVQTLWDKTARGQGRTHAIDYYNDSTFYWCFTSRKIRNKMNETDWRKANVSKGFSIKKCFEKRLEETRNLMCLSLVSREFQSLGGSSIQSCLCKKVWPRGKQKGPICGFQRIWEVFGG